jgi:hypothetical protein
MLVQLWTGQEVRQRVVYAGPVTSLYDVNIGAVVDEEEERLSCEKRGVCSRACNYCQQLTPRYLSVRMVEMCVFRRVDPAERSPDPEVLGKSDQRRNGGSYICSDIDGSVCRDNSELW